MKCLHNQSFISVRNPNSVIMTLLGVTEGRPEDIVSLLYFWFFCANVSRASFSHTHCWGSARRPTVWYVLGWLLLWTSRSWRFCETQKSQQRNNTQVCCLVVEPLLFKGLKATTTDYCLKTNYAYSQWTNPVCFLSKVSQSLHTFGGSRGTFCSSWLHGSLCTEMFIISAILPTGECNTDYTQGNLGSSCASLQRHAFKLCRLE